MAGLLSLGASWAIRGGKADGYERLVHVAGMLAELEAAYERGNGRMRRTDLVALSEKLAGIATEASPRGAQLWHITEDGITSVLTGTSRSDAIEKWAEKQGVNVADMRRFPIAREGWYGRTVLTPTGRPLTVYAVRDSEWNTN